MDASFSPLWTDTSTEQRMTGTWRSAVPDYRTSPSPCLGACPVSGRIAEWIGQVKANDIHGAWLTLVDNNPFPAIAGRICHHPCETSCNRKNLDETVGICALERFVGDTALAEGWAFPEPTAKTDKSVAIVGAGPAGLSAAYQLRRLGIAVSIFDSSSQTGGLLRYGIPAYRLEKSVLDGEINRLLDMGISLHLETEIPDVAALRKLRSEHDAVFLATGASKPKKLPALDYSQPWVLDSAEFLATTNTDGTYKLGEHVLVIGGGSAAMDVSRTARRLGSKVTVLSLEPEHLLPAQRIEITEAVEEGIEFVTAAMLTSADHSTGGLTVNSVRVDFKPGDQRGDFAALPVKGSDFTIAADTIIPSIGQDADLGRWEGYLAASGPVLKSSSDWSTDVKGVFTGGDVASMDRFVTQAVGVGKEVAHSIASYVNAASDDPKQDLTAEIPFERINTAYHPVTARNKPDETDPTTRLQDFQEVQQPLGMAEALAEASRCFSCGVCTLCDNCYFYCPDMAITKLDDGYAIKSDYCKGCGLCVAECPTGAIVMHEDFQP